MTVADDIAAALGRPGRPGVSEDHLRQVLAAAGKLTPAAVSTLRRLLPTPSPEPERRMAAVPDPERLGVALSIIKAGLDSRPSQKRAGAAG